MYEDDKNEQGGVNNNSYGSGQGNNTYSYNPYSYGNGGQNTYGYGNNASTNQNTSYSYNNQSGVHGYGTYQYGGTDYSYAANGANAAPVKKKHTGAAVVAAIAILALVVGGVGASYYAISNNLLKIGITADISKEVAEAEPEEKTEAKQTQDEEKVQTTTVTAQTKAVVTDVTAVVEEVMPAMVIIHNNYTQSANFFGYQQTQEATASGSGIIVGQSDSELLIATNYHVIEGADTLEVIFNDETTINADVKGTNADMDLAVIAVQLSELTSDTIDSIKVATLGDSDALVLGEPAIAIGNALGYGQSVTTGVISALNRQVEIESGNTREFIQTDAAINPGNSGGALLNLQGEVIGINSNKIGGDTVEGMGYAIPISAAKPIIEELMNEETKIKYSADERGYIGISGVSVTSDVSQVYGLPIGVYVAEVSNDGGAQAAGLEKGDVIVEFEGREITSMEDLQTWLQYYPVGDTVSVTVMRQSGSGYEEETFDVTLGGAASLSGQDSNASEEKDGSSDKYDGSQAPGKPEDKNHGSDAGQGEH